MRLLSIAIFLFITTFVNATNYYISPAGSDNNAGTLEAPFFTLNKAWSVAKPGDVIYARGGTYKYNSRQNLTGKDGTARDSLKIWAYPGERPVFTKSASFTTPSFPVSLIYVNADYVHIRGIEVAYFTQKSSAVWYGIAVQGSNHCKFERINSHHNGHGMGIRNECSNNLVLNSDFHHNSDPLTSYGNADGLAVAYHSSSVTNTIRGCRMWNNSDDGLDLWDNNGNLILENSWAWRNGYLANGSAAGDGCGFKFGKTTTESGSSFKRTVRNTIAVYNRSRGYNQNAANVKFYFYHNIAWKNSKGIEFPTNNLAHVFRNNIVFDNSTNWSGTYSNSLRDHNSNDPEPVASSSDFISIDTTGMSGRRKAGGELPDLNFMKLAAGSDLIDAGVNLGLAFTGNAPDIGAYESTQASAPVASIPPSQEPPSTTVPPAQEPPSGSVPPVQEPPVSTTPPSQPAPPADTSKVNNGTIAITPFLARDRLSITNYSQGNEASTLKITDYSGKLCYEVTLENQAMMSDLPVRLAPGFYIARITVGNEVKYVQKLVFVK